MVWQSEYSSTSPTRTEGTVYAVTGHTCEPSSQITRSHAVALQKCGTPQSRHAAHPLSYVSHSCACTLQRGSVNGPRSRCHTPSSRICCALGCPAFFAATHSALLTVPMSAAHAGSRPPSPRMYTR
eukprot:3035774-Rhodomonas_salina.1